MRATRLFADWCASGERRRLSVDSAIAREVAWRSRALDRFFCRLVRKSAVGSVFVSGRSLAAGAGQALGQFLPIDLTAKRREEATPLHSQAAAAGSADEPRVVGLWEPGIPGSRSRCACGDRVAPGSAGWEPEHYQIDVSIDPRKGTIEGSVVLELQGGRDGWAWR